MTIDSDLLEKKRAWIRSRESQTIHAALGIELTRLEPNLVEGKMPVDARTHQPAGLLHGGASVVLAESLASIGGVLLAEGSDQAPVGVEINANHLRSVKSGWVYGRAVPLHAGRRLQVWSIEIRDEAQNLVCVSRLTLTFVKAQHE